MEFISYEGPTGLKAAEKRQIVRSYVTKRQHRLRREAEQMVCNQLIHLANTSPESGQQALSSHPRRSVSKRNGLALFNTDEQPPSWMRDQTLPQHYGLSSSRRSKQSLAGLYAAVRKNAILRTCNSPSLPPRVPFEPMLPCDTALNTLESYLHATMFPAHVAALGLDSSELQVASQWFSTSSVSEPALYTSALLTAAAEFKQSSPDLVHYLKSTTIVSLVQALANAQRRSDPALILAIQCLTFYECLCGDKSMAQKVHRPAMRRLIKSHGGRDGVEMPLSWKKMSLTADIVMEIQMGSEGDISFLHDETHQNGGILEAEWTEALRFYLPDVEEKLQGVRERRDQTSNDCRE